MGTRKRIQPGMLVKEIKGHGIVQVGPDGKDMISVSRVGRVLPFDKKKAAAAFDSVTKIGASSATSGRSQYIYVDFTKKLNPSLQYGDGKTFVDLAHLALFNKTKKNRTQKNKKRRLG
jgi:hypothetical protein